MRLVAVLVAALAVAAPASAAEWPPPVPQTPAVVKFERAHSLPQSRSCMARFEKVKIARWLAPVACEQPPRSQLLLAALFGE